MTGGLVCKGDWSLGTACGQCERCRGSARSNIAELAEWRNTFDLLREGLNPARDVKAEPRSLIALAGNALAMRARIAELERQNYDLQAANNRYLKRARDVREALEKASAMGDALPELNMSNYTHDDADDLNNASVELCLFLRDAIAKDRANV